MTQVKICGLTSYEDALAAAKAGADLLGFNFYKKSPRYVTPEQAQAICDQLRNELGASCPLLVGLFVNEIVGNISAISSRVGLDAVQLSGDESDVMLKELRGMAYKAIRPADRAQALDDVAYYRPQFPSNVRMPALLLDAYHPELYGGTGVQANLEIALAVKAEVPRLMLAGGLTADNVAGVISAVQPWGVDVASGVEVEDAPGKKDVAKVQAFIQAVKAA